MVERGDARPGWPGPVQEARSDAAVGVTGSTQALRRRIFVCACLLLGIGLAGVAMPATTHRSRLVSTGEVAAPPTTGTTATTSAPRLIVPTAPSTAATPSAPTLPRTSPPTSGHTASTSPPATTAPAAPPVSTTPPQPANCGDRTLKKPDGSTWRCSFDDEFDGTSVDTTKWRVQATSWNGFHSGAECFVDDPDNVSVSGGALHLTVRQEKYGFTCAAPKKPYGSQYTSGMLTSFGKFTQAYGRFEIRAKVPPAKVKGLQSSFWLWPENPQKYGAIWPASGEIDIAEAFSRWPDRLVPYIHYTGSTYNTTNNNCIVGDTSQYHTYVLVWTQQTMTITYDGATCLVSEWYPLALQPPAPFDQPFMISLTQALGIDSNAFVPGSTPLPATTTVDYVRVWK
jgi:beta-glucanase (GH16 family)